LSDDEWLVMSVLLLALQQLPRHCACENLPATNNASATMSCLHMA